MRILALQLKRIGDLVLTTPALRALRTIVPEARVSLGVSDATCSLLPAIEGIEGAIVFGRGRGFAPWQQVLTGRWDVCLDFTGSDRSALAAALSRAARRITFESVRDSKLRSLAYREFVESRVRDSHTADHYLHLLRPFGGSIDKLESVLPAARETPGAVADANACAETLRLEQPTLKLPEAARLQARAALQGVGVDWPFALIHPGTARTEKYWVAERWATVIGHLQRGLGLGCVLSGEMNPMESAHLAAIRAAVLGGCPSVAGKTDLLTLSALAAEASVVVSCDTGVVHLAAAFGTPQVALYGPTNPFHWRPRHPRAVVLSATHPDAPLTVFEPRMPGAPMERLSTELVIRAIDTLLTASQSDRGEHGPRGVSAPFPPP